MEIFSKFLILDNEWQRKSQPQSQARASRHISSTYPQGVSFELHYIPPPGILQVFSFDYNLNENYLLLF